MDAAQITAICTGIPAILGAVTALILAFKSNGKSNATAAALDAHTKEQD